MSRARCLAWTVVAVLIYCAVRSTTVCALYHVATSSLVACLVGIPLGTRDRQDEYSIHSSNITNHAPLKRWRSRSRNPMKEPSQSPRALPLIRLALAALDLSALVEEGEVREGAQQARAAQLAGRAPRL